MLILKNLGLCVRGEMGKDKLWQRDVCAGCKQKKILVAQDPDTNDYFCSQCWGSKYRYRS